MKPYAFGVDIGGTTIKMGFFDTEGKFLDKWEITTRTENNGEKVLPDIARSIKKKLKENELTLGRRICSGRKRRQCCCPGRAVERRRQGT